MSATVDGRVRFGGWSIVAGRESRRGTVEFRAFEPAAGRDSEEVYHAASPEDVDGACRAAAEAFGFTRRSSREERARLLEGAAERVERMGDGLLELASRETGLDARPRLEGELRRTVFTLRMFAGVAREGRWARAAVDPADAARTPNPRPELRSLLRPLGPVAVFGAGNFPLAYSTAGGDTASALAAGCPVIVKGHPGHPGTGEAVAWAVCEAALEAGFPAGVFSFLHAGGEREMQVGTEVVLHPAVRAVGFTGSFGGGMAAGGPGARARRADSGLRGDGVGEPGLRAAGGDAGRRGGADRGDAGGVGGELARADVHVPGAGVRRSGGCGPAGASGSPRGCGRRERGRCWGGAGGRSSRGGSGRCRGSRASSA
ncbi:MAG: aldehyde dehydrogenase family protein [Phycisphaerales bacterium]|nr:aldehyde dehydrogenase family protein [Phycisphaerales bacterium]